MSVEYDEYIKNHKNNVAKAFTWLKKYLFDMFDKDVWHDAEFNTVYGHDMSKYEKDEYEAYDEYFYGGNKSYDVVDKFNRAWLLHIHRNPHHWQYWILKNDDPSKSDILIDMPDCYIIEMVCDWWSFSWNKKDLYEIFKWYDNRKHHMQLSDYTRKKVEDILSEINLHLTENEWNAESNDVEIE